MTRRLAEILEDKLNKGDEALAALERLADQGDAALPRRVRRARRSPRLEGHRRDEARRVERVDVSAPIATRPCARPSIASSRSAATRTPRASRWSSRARRAPINELADKLEQLATRLKNLDALGRARHPREGALGRRARGRAGPPGRGARPAGVDPLEAMQHGEAGPRQRPSRRGRAAARAPRGAHAGARPRHRSLRAPGRPLPRPADRLVALARAAQVAAERGANDRARASSSSPSAAACRKTPSRSLEDAARIGDEKAGGNALRSILAEALAAGGQGSRDGGRTRARSSAAPPPSPTAISRRRRAFHWLGDALIAHVDDASLDALEAASAARSTTSSASSRRSAARSKRSSTARSSASSSTAAPSSAATSSATRRAPPSISRSSTTSRPPIRRS
jgi:hypothetical protein